ncbi:hypothetical protein [Sphingomonas sanguinis]|uniref:hypothetical protein n=1 Tax=Sphingomonas sanguinis TaxID=33051 RepID=UPI00128F91F9|nr:hypothetical protein [Sphingomonas sanguinis]
MIGWRKRRYVPVMYRDSSARHSPTRLTFLALVAAKEIADERASGPVEQSAALRVVLGYLHGVSGGDRRIYDDFWRYCRDDAFPGDHSGYAASTHMFSCWQGMVRRAGIRLTIDMMERFNSVARSPVRDNFASRVAKAAE